MNESPAIATTGRQPRPAAIAVRLAFRASAAFCILSAFAPDLTAADWPQWRGLKRDGHSYETGWMTNWPPSTPLWWTDIGWGFSSVAISEGSLYTAGYTTTGGNSNIVYCFDAVTGTQRWSRALPYTSVSYGGPRATPVIDGNRLYFFDSAGRTYCLDRQNGSTVWTNTLAIGRVSPSSTDWGYSSSPLVEGDLVIVNSGGGAAVNKYTGAIVWTNSGNAGYASPVPYTSTNGERLVVMMSSDGVHGLVATNGQERWYFPWAVSHNALIGEPILYKDKVFISTGYGKGSALIQLGGSSPTSIWANANLACKTSSTILDGDYIYGLNEPDYGGNGTLKCIDIRSGTIKWTSPNLGGEGAISAGDGILVVLDPSVNLCLVKLTPTNYVQLGAPFNVTTGGSECRTAPVLCNGLLYARYQARLACYRVGPIPETDGDKDGIPDVWEQKHFGSTNNCQPNADGDGDGISNRAEYLAGTNPTNILSYLNMTMTNAGGKLTLTTPTVKAEGTGYFCRARFYSMEFATSLTGSAWCETPDCMDVVGTNAPICYTNVPAGPPKFYRMKVTLE